MCGLQGEMKILNARYLIERWPEGFLILFIVMYKKNKHTVAYWFRHSHCLSHSQGIERRYIMLIFKYLIKNVYKRYKFWFLLPTVDGLAPLLCLCVPINNLFSFRISVLLNKC